MPIKPNDVEQIKQWGIKSMSSRVIEEIQDAAHDLKITNGQMIEKLWAAWKAEGGPTAVMSNPVDSLAKLMAAGGPWGENNQLPAQVRSLMNGYARAARGVDPNLKKQSRLTDDQVTRLPPHLVPPPGKTGLEDLDEIEAAG